MDFAWDHANTEHITRHDVTTEEAEQVVENDPLEIQKLERNGEKRIVHLGETDAGRLLVVATTVRDERIRVVTAYPAKRKWRRFFSRTKGGQL